MAVIWDGKASREEKTWLSRREVVEYGRASSSFEGLAAYTTFEANLTGVDQPERVTAGAVTASAFPVLGVTAALGRPFRAEEDVAGSDDVVVLGDGLWRRRFGADARIVGATVRLNGRARTVVGVMPRGFTLPVDYLLERSAELWVPLAIDMENPGGWGDRSYYGFGRLRPGVTAERASAELGVIGDRWVEAGFLRDDGSGRWRRSAIPAADLVLGRVRPTLLVLLGAVGFTLLIACANVANLLLARADERRKEMAIRAALGAGRRRIVTQLLAESVVLAALGGTAGVAFGFLGIRLLRVLGPSSIPRLADAGIDAGALAFTAQLALLTGFLFGLVPALQTSRPDLTGTLKEGGRQATTGRARRRFRGGLVATETALSVVLVIGAGLFIRSFAALERVELGFREERALTFRVAVPRTDYPEDADVVAFHRALLERVRSVPGVETAGATRFLPLTGTIGDWSITIEGRPERPGENPNGDWQVVMPGYLEAMGIRLARGRAPTDADREDALPVAVINETMAERYWPGQDALGKRFHLGRIDQPWITIAGITRDVRHNAVLEEPRAEMYLPHSQFPLQGAEAPRAMTYILRTGGEPLALAAPVRELVRELDRNLPVADVRTLDDVVGAALSGPRFTTVLLALFAALALVLAAVGTYGVIAYAVTQRRREIGIRMALGARSRQVQGMIVREGMRTSAVGVAIGLVAAFFLTRLLAGLLYGVTLLDPATFLAVTAVLLMVSALASYLPARRAAAVDPIAVLREE